MRNLNENGIDGLKTSQLSYVLSQVKEKSLGPSQISLGTIKLTNLTNHLIWLIRVNFILKANLKLGVLNTVKFLMI